jgi:hypothetical protein
LYFPLFQKFHCPKFLFRIKIPKIEQKIKSVWQLLHCFSNREDPNSRQNTVREIVRRTEDKKYKWPQLIIFPEGSCSNRKVKHPETMDLGAAFYRWNFYYHYMYKSIVKNLFSLQWVETNPSNIFFPLWMSVFTSPHGTMLIAYRCQYMDVHGC